MGMKIFTLLRSKFVFILSYDNCFYVLYHLQDDCVFLLLDNGFSGTLAVEFHEDSRIINPEFQGHFDLYSFPWKGNILKIIWDYLEERGYI